MYLYTESHIISVFIMGVLNGLVGAFVVSELKSSYRVTKLLLKMALRPLIKNIKRKGKLKVPTVKTVSTTRVSA